MPPQAPPELRDPPPAVLPDIQPVRLETVRWKVIEVDGQSGFALTARDYEALSRNMAELARWTKEARFQIDFYRNNARQAGDRKSVP